MIPIGYMYKIVAARTGWLKTLDVDDIFSVCACASDYFADYIKYWKHNGYWLFDSPRIIEDIAKKAKIDLSGMTLFYYEAHEQEFDEKTGIWSAFAAYPSFETDVRAPADKNLWGFDVVQVLVHSDLGCSPLSCNGLAKKLPVNRLCLFDGFEQAKHALDNGLFVKCEPGPYRIIAVYTPGDDQQ
jgi:hypothetical protein